MRVRNVLLALMLIAPLGLGAESEARNTKEGMQQYDLSRLRSSARWTIPTHRVRINALPVTDPLLFTTFARVSPAERPGVRLR